MNNFNNIINGHSTAESRWARFGPYYAMFPVDFAFQTIQQHSQPGQRIIDPFAGRGSCVFAGAALGRKSVGIEINPVGWVYGSTKLSPAPKADVEKRLKQLYAKKHYYKCQAENLPEFYHLCYCREVLTFLLAARKHLNWQGDNTDSTLMSIILLHLHGKLGEGLSNQMRMTKSMGMNYSIHWWKRNGYVSPPQINPLDFLRKKIDWRYARGIPKLTSEGKMIFGDSTMELQKLREGFDLLFTSPPYCGLTNYHADQWLRLWMLGEQTAKTVFSEKHCNRFVNKDDYRQLLLSVFGQCAEMMNRRSTIYVRTDAREWTLQTTKDILLHCFPKHKLMVWQKPLLKQSQTQLFGDKTIKPGEVDLILR